MKKAATMTIEKRLSTKSSANRRLRKTGYLPGSIYGKEMQSIPVMIEEKELKKKLFEFGRNSVYSLDLPGDRIYTVMIKDIHFMPLNEEYLHINFQKVSLAETIKADVEIILTGKDIFEAQKLHLLQQMNSLPVKGLPQDIPDTITIDISHLQTGESITVDSIVLPKGIMADISPDQVIATIHRPKSNDNEEENIDKSEDKKEAEESK